MAPQSVCVLLALALICGSCGSHNLLIIAPDSNRGIDRAVEDDSRDGVQSNLAELLDEMRENPIDLNRASIPELQQLPGVSRVIAERISEHRAGAFLTRVEDLLQVEGMDAEILEVIRPFVTVENGRESKSHYGGAVSWRSRLTSSLFAEDQQQPERLSWLTSRLQNRLVARLSVESGPSKAKGEKATVLSFGLVTEKDQGERNGSDFLSGSLQCAIPAYSVRLVLGDFAFDGAQGMVFSRAFRSSKGTNVTGGIGRRGKGVRMSLASETIGFYRGVAGVYESAAFTASAFCSVRQLDADVDSSGAIAQFDEDGLHRTADELRKKNAARESLAAARFELNAASGLNLGFSCYRSVFDREMQLTGHSGLHGRFNSVFGIDAEYVNGLFSAFCEIGRDHARATSGILGFSLDSGKRLSAAVVVRAYDRRFRNSHGSGFGESGDAPANESGAYCAVRFRISEWLNLSTFYDQFAFPWPRTSMLLPSSGDEFMITADLRPSRSIELELKYRHKERSSLESAQTETGLAAISESASGHQTVRLTLVVGRSSPLVWKSRVEIVRVQPPHRRNAETGMMIYQECSGAIAPALSISVRAAAFETGSFDSRLYVCENELPGAYLTPALYGRGFRWYVVGRYRAGEWLGLAARFAQTRVSGFRLQSPATRVALQLEVHL